MKQNRPKTPEWLQKNYKKWGKRYAKNIVEKPSYKFQWATYKGQKVNQQLTPLLAGITQKHCSFCDAFPMEERLLPTIEHFRPKSKYPLLAYVWHNLFLCCSLCQAKNDNFDKRLLKPDQLSYDFEKYFTYNFRTGELAPNPALSATDIERVKVTLELYGLNKHGKPRDRKRTYKVFNQLVADDKVHVNDIPYRFLFS